jgi:DHA1 family multidrug resistance protein-like MFS transporter
VAEPVLDNGGDGRAGLYSVCRGAERDTSRRAECGHNATINPAEKLLNRFFISRLLVTTLSVAVILTYVNVSPVLLMETMGFDRGEYSTVMAATAMVSMAVSFSTPFALNIFRQRTLMLTSQVLFLAAGVILATTHSHAIMLAGIT